MHTDRIMRLADIIERSTGRFDMGEWQTCIAGYCKRHLVKVVGSAEEATRIRRAAATPRPLNVTDVALGINGSAADLYSAGAAGRHRFNRRHAAKVPRHLAATGEVDWVNPTATPEPTAEERKVRGLFARILTRVKRNERTVRRLEREANAAAREPTAA